MRVLLTRPAVESERTAARLRASGHEVLVSPVLRIEPRGQGAIAADAVQAVLFTSVNGVRYGAARLTPKDRPAFCVGDRTAEAAGEAGLAPVHSADGDAAALAALVAEMLDPAEGVLLHLCGAHTTEALAKDLAAAGFALRREVVYAARPAERLADDAMRALRSGDIDLVLLYSPRSARRFVELVAGGPGLESLAGVRAAVLSPAVAQAAKAAPFAQVTVAPAPSEAALLEALGLGATEATA